MARTTRRRFLATAGAAVAAAVGLTGSASADGVPELQTPDSVSLSYDETRLERYQPRMITSTENRPRIKALYGYIAEDSERDLTAYAYILQLSHQRGLPGVSLDSHLGDHELAFVYVDETGTPVKTVYAAYHHYAAVKTLSEDNLVADRTDEKTHVDALRVTDPYHHFIYEQGQASGFIELRNWLNVRESWARNDFYSETANEAVDNPFVMIGENARATWWADDTTDRQLVLLWRLLGIGGASAADDTRGSLL